MNMVLVFAAVALVLGLLPGLLLFPAAASPFAPGLWVLNAPFARIFHTIAQVIRGQGVLVKRKSGTYEAGQYDPEREQVFLSDGWHNVNAERTTWALFGKRPFGVTWEEGTDLHERVAREGDGEDGLPINMGAVHRYLRGANEADAISRTEQAAAAEYGGGDDGISTILMAVLIGAMAVMGSLTTYVML